MNKGSLGKPVGKLAALKEREGAKVPVFACCHKSSADLLPDSTCVRVSLRVLMSTCKHAR